MLAVIDYKIGNLQSAQKAFEFLGAQSCLTSDIKVIENASGIVLPGVGAFGKCMDSLEQSGLIPHILKQIARGVPFLGICIGFQLLFESSEESPGKAGLGVIDGKVVKLPAGEKCPQMQWNRLSVLDPTNRLFTGIDTGSWMYFVHSYFPKPTKQECVIATCDYGTTVVSAVDCNNVFGVQFHPEKSGQNGLRLLSNFVDLCE